MPLIDLIIILIVLGVVLYLVNNFIPMDPKFKTILNVVIVVVLIIWLLQSIGGIADYRIGR